MTRKGTEYDEEIALRVMNVGHAAEWVRISCPPCEDEGKTRPNMSVNVESGKAICHRCGFETWAPVEGSARTVKRALRSIYQDDMEPPKGFIRIADDPKASVCRDAMKYILNRGVAKSTVVEMGIGVVPPGYKDYWRWAGRIVIPQRYKGQVLGWVGRVCLDDDERVTERAYMNTKGFDRTFLLNADALSLRSKRPILWCEGPFDFLRHYPYAIPSLGKPTDAQIAIIAKHARRPIVSGIDADAWRKGIAVAMRLVRELQRRRKSLDVFVLTDKGSGLDPGTDPGDTSRKRLRRLVERSRRVFSSAA
jgi:hypothetical protein